MTLYAGAVGGGPVYSCIAATTGHSDTLSTGPGRLWGLVIGTAAANATIALYDSTDTSAPIAVINVSSAATPESRSFNFHGLVFKRRLVAVTTAAQVSTVIHS
jgi:hypothetical protein